MASTGQEWKSASWKEEEDHSAETRELLDRINASTIEVLLRSTNRPFDEFIDEILVVEKKARLGNDTFSTQKLAVEVISILRLLKKYDAMMEQLDSLMKKRNQMKQVQSAMVAEAAKAIDDRDTSEELRAQLLNKLCHVTEGKIHIELEHARFSVQLAAIAEREGRKKEASDTLAALQVETITNMPRLEKLNIIIHQLELALEIGDSNLVQVTSRKINQRAINRDDTKDIKRSYFHLMLQHYAQTNQYLLLARCWHELYLTESDDDKKLAALSNAVVLCLIAPHQSQKEIEDTAECCAFSPKSMQTNRATWMKELEATKRVEEELQGLHELLKHFNTVELIRDKVQGAVDEIAGHHPQLAEFPERRQELASRLSEHDLLVVAKYYSRIHIADLADLVGLTPARTEQFMMELVQTKSLYAKIDRIEGLVVFQRSKNPTEVVAHWNDGVQKLVDLLEKTSHLVVKERMMHSTFSAAPVAAVAE